MQPGEGERGEEGDQGKPVAGQIKLGQAMVLVKSHVCLREHGEEDEEEGGGSHPCGPGPTCGLAVSRAVTPRAGVVGQVRNHPIHAAQQAIYSRNVPPPQQGYVISNRILLRDITGICYYLAAASAVVGREVCRLRPGRSRGGRPPRHRCAPREAALLEEGD